jgi:hypothetical protein
MEAYKFVNQYLDKKLMNPESEGNWFLEPVTIN